MRRGLIIYNPVSGLSSAYEELIRVRAYLAARGWSIDIEQTGGPGEAGRRGGGGAAGGARPPPPRARRGGPPATFCGGRVEGWMGVLPAASSRARRGSNAG